MSNQEILKWSDRGEYRSFLRLATAFGRMKIFAQILIDQLKIQYWYCLIAVDWLTWRSTDLIHLSPAWTLQNNNVVSQSVFAIIALLLNWFLSFQYSLKFHPRSCMYYCGKKVKCLLSASFMTCNTSLFQVVAKCANNYYFF